MPCGLLGGGSSHCMAAPDMLFAGRACTFQHAQLGALQQKPLLGRLQASRWGPYSPGPRPNILGCCGGPNRAQTTVKSPSQVPEKNLSDVFTLYFKCIWDVITTYSYALTMYQ